MLRNIIRMAEKSIYPIKNVLESPSLYPSFMGTLDGFDITALPKVYNPITAVGDDGDFKLLWTNFEDGTSVMKYKPKSNGYVYREFVMKDGAIIAYSEIEPGGSPKWGEIIAQCSLGYLGIRKVTLEGNTLKSKLKKYGIFSTPLPSFKNYVLYNFYRHLDIEEQGLSTNLEKTSAIFMPGCKMHRMSLASFLTIFPFEENSSLIADWDYGYCPSVGPATDKGHVDIKLNPLWLKKNRPWKKYMQNIDGNFYRDLLNNILKDNKALWTMDGM